MGIREQEKKKVWTACEKYERLHICGKWDKQFLDIFENHYKMTCLKNRDEKS